MVWILLLPLILVVFGVGFTMRARRPCAGSHPSDDQALTTNAPAGSHVALAPTGRPQH